MSLLPNANISPIPNTEPDAIPSLWNDRYEEIDENFQSLDAELVKLLASGVSAAVLDTLTTPPVSPSGGDRYIVGSGATGDWADHDTEIAEYNSTSGAWDFSEPGAGLLVWENDAGTFYYFNGTSWAVLSSTVSHPSLSGRSSADQHPASSITNTPSGNISSTTVQAALNELDSEKLKIASNLSDLANAATARTNLGLGTANSPSFAGLTLTGDVQMSDNGLFRPYLKDYAEYYVSLGSAGGTRTVNLANGNVYYAQVATSTNTFVFSNPPASGRAGSFTLILRNGGSQTVNWPSSVDWPGGNAPSLTSSGYDVLTFITTDGGTTWYGFVAGLDVK